VPAAAPRPASLRTDRRDRVDMFLISFRRNFDDSK
jgi:hypothetical protein